MPSCCSTEFYYGFAITPLSSFFFLHLLMPILQTTPRRVCRGPQCRRHFRPRGVIFMVFVVLFVVAVDRQRTAAALPRGLQSPAAVAAGSRSPQQSWTSVLSADVRNGAEHISASTEQLSRPDFVDLYRYIAMVNGTLMASRPEPDRRLGPVHVEPTIFCQPGFKLTGPECVREDVASARLGCNDGWNLANGVCEAVEVMRPRYTCPDDFHTHNASCIRDISAPHMAECPPGFVLTPSKTCLREIKAEASPICKNDETLVAFPTPRCTRERKVAPVRRCTNGFSIDRTLGQCHKEQTRPARHACPKGLRMHSNGTCIGTVRTGATPECPKGYILDAVGGVCRFGDGRALDGWSCPTGAILDRMARACYAEETVAPHLRCPKGFQEADGRCLGLEDVDVVYTCPRGHTPDGASCVRGRFKKPGVPTCPPGAEYSLTRRTCSRSTSLEPERACPEGTTVRGAGGTVECARRKTVGGPYCQSEDCRSHATLDIEPVYTGCPPDFTLSPSQGDCERRVYRPVQNECDEPGFLLNSQGICVRLELMEATLECPHDFELIDGGCKDVLSTEPRYTCPDRFRLTAASEGHSHHAKQGHVADSVPPRYCESQEVVRPIVRCPDNYSSTAEGSRCWRREVREATVTCDKDFEIVFDQCIRGIREPPKIVCPTGTRFRGDDEGPPNPLLIQRPNNALCVGTSRMKPLYSCPRGFTFYSASLSCVQEPPPPPTQQHHYPPPPPPLQGVASSPSSSFMKRVEQISPTDDADTPMVSNSAQHWPRTPFVTDTLSPEAIAMAAKLIAASRRRQASTPMYSPRVSRHVARRSG